MEAKEGAPEAPRAGCSTGRADAGLCPGRGESSRARDVCKGEDGVQGKARTVDPGPPADPAPLTWGPDAGVPARSWAAGPTPHRAPAAGRPKSTAPAEQEARRPGDPEGRRYCSHGPGLPGPPPAPAAPRPVPAPPNAARSTHARLAAALALEKSYWSSDLISGTRKVLRSGPGPGGAASTMAPPGLRTADPRSLGLGCAALAPRPPPLPSQVRPLALATLRRPRPGAEPRCAPPPARCPRLASALAAGWGAEAAEELVCVRVCACVRVSVRARTGKDEGPCVCACVCWSKCVSLDAHHLCGLVFLA